MNPAIALQFFSVRNSLQKDYVGTLEKVAQIGYRNVELISTVTPEGLVFGKDLRAPELRKHLDSFGLRAVSCHFVPNAEMLLENILADLQVLGVDKLVDAIAFFPDPSLVVDFIQTFNHYGELCKQHGVQLYYHNHYHEFQVYGDRSIYELMMEQMDRDLVKFEFDAYWAARGGQDPIYWLKKLGKRCDMLHQKDLPATVATPNMFEKIGYDSPITMEIMWKTQEPEGFIEIGDGILNIPGIFKAFRTHNDPRYIIIEQDMSKFTELESIKISLANLNRILG